MIACDLLVLAAALSGAAPKDMSVYGRAPVGAFGVDALEHVEGAAKLGMTLIYSYSPESARKQLDLDDPMGQAVAKHKMQVMYPLCGRFTQVRLAHEIGPADTTIPVAGERADSAMSFPKSGYLMIEGERIEYASRSAGAFEGCRRGADGTRAAPHGAGLLLCDSEALRREILAVKDAPGLWGWWLVDDNRPREIDSLREMSRIIRLADRDTQGRLNHHIIVMGIGGSSAMANFDAGICDALGVYPYPYRHGKLDVTTRNQMRFIMTRARSLQPGIGLIGIYQAFGCGEKSDSPQWKDMPTPEQVREDMLSFYDWGADGVMAFIYHWRGTNPKEPLGLDAVPGIRDMIGRTNEEILAGKVKRTVPPVGEMEWMTILTGPEAKLSPGGRPAYDLDDPAKLASLVKGRPDRLSAEAFAVDGRSYPLKVRFPAWNKADPKSDRWPIAQFAAGELTATDWSRVRALEQPIYNPGEETIVVLVSLEDAAKGWWQRSVEIPPRVPMLLVVPMDEARLSIDPSRIQRWLLWESDPPAAVEFRLGTPMLAPVDKISYTTYTTFDQVLEGRDARYAALTRVSDPGTAAQRAYTGFFFYQVLQFDPTGRYLLGQKVYFENRDVRADDRADIGYFDLEDGNKWTKIGESTAWNWQQGARLQWRPRSDEIVWNDRSDDGKAFVCRTYDFRTGARRTLPRPIYDISPDGTTALTHNFERMRLFHGTEYVGIEDRYEKEFAPGKTGIWKMDMETGKAEMILSLEKMAAVAYPKGLPSSGHLYFFREGWNPSGTRFVAFIKDPANQLFEAYSVAPDGTDVRYLYHNPSHHSWRDDHHILDFGHHAPPGGGSPQGGYFLFEDDGTGQAKDLLWPSDHDGHDSYVPGPGGDWILSDTYVLAGYQYLFLYHIPTKLFVPLAKLKSTAEDAVGFQDEHRVDLHPRLSRNGRMVSIDATYEGLGRQMYLLDIGYILDHPPVRR